MREEEEGEEAEKVGVWAEAEEEGREKERGEVGTGEGSEEEAKEVERGEGREEESVEGMAVEKADGLEAKGDREAGESKQSPPKR